MPKGKLPEALDLLIEEDKDLFVLGVNERSLTHKLAEHLQTLFPDWQVDCEYNRIGRDDITKRLALPIRKTKTDDTEAKTVFPDVIVHRRGENDNLLVIEVKKSNNTTDLDHDLQKLNAFVNQLNYQYAAHVILRLGTNPDYTLTWIHP